MYYVSSYYLKDGKSTAYQQWLQSDEAKALYADVEKETGWHFIETYWPIMGFGEFDCEDWWDVPDWSSLDKARESEAMSRLLQRWNELDFADNERDSSARMLRGTRDVRIWE